MKRKIVLIPLALLLAGFGAIGCPPVEEPVEPVVPVGEVFEWTMQTTWPAGLYLHDGAIRFAEKVREMSGGRLNIDVLPAGTIVGAFDVLDTVHEGVLDMGHGWSAYWAGRHPAAHLFSSAIGGPFGMDNLDYVNWLYFGGGLELYRELYAEELGLNVLVFPVDIIVAEPFGWFKEPITAWEDLEGLKMREAGLTAEVYKEAGITVVMLPGGEILPAMEKGVIDAAAFMCPTSDKQLGLMDVAKYYHTPSVHRPTGTLELLVNKDSWDRLPADLKAIVEIAARESLLHSWMRGLHLNVDDLETLKKEHGVTVVRTPDEILMKVLEAWDAVAAKYAAENPFFARVYQSQKDFAEGVVSYRLGFYAPYEFAAHYYWEE